jgi:hypothetical protein
MSTDLKLSGAAACSILAVAVQALVPSATSAQDLRYLSWNGKPTQPPAQSQPQGQAQSRAPAPSRQPVATYPSTQSARPSRYSPSVASGALTPADAWFQPPAQPISPPPSQAYEQPQPQAQQPYAPQGQAYGHSPAQPLPLPAYATQQSARQQGLPVPAYAAQQQAPQQQPAQHRPAPAYSPRFETAGQHQQFQPQQPQPQQTQPPAAWTQPGYAPQVYPAQPQSMIASNQAPANASPVVQGQGWASPQPAMTGALTPDPMAPRRDAPIFSIQAQTSAPQPAPVQTSQQPPVQAAPQAMPAPLTVNAAGPAREGARYYSVHRQAGHQPDPTQIPESVYAVIPEGAFLDAARTDLADPPAAPVATRNINGRLQQVDRGDGGGQP